MFFFPGGQLVEKSSKVGIIIFTKVPIPGLVKTRIVNPKLDKDFSCDLQIAMLKDTILGLKDFNFDYLPILSFFPENKQELLKKLILHPLKKIYPNFVQKIMVTPQKGDNFETRFTNALRFVFTECNLDTAIIIGSDTPHLQPNLIVESVNHLKKSSTNAVLGPSQNGGFYLRAHNKPFISNIGTIFEDSSPHGEVVQAMKLLSTKNEVLVLPEVTDIDSLENLITVGNIIKILSLTHSSFSKTIRYYYPKFTAELIAKEEERLS